MAEIKVTVSDTQVKCLEYAAYSVQDWCDNAIHNRARIAQEEIIELLVAHCNENSIDNNLIESRDEINVLFDILIILIYLLICIFLDSLDQFFWV